MPELGTGPSRAELALETLREEFDRSFSQPFVEDASDVLELVAIRLGDCAYALASAELGGITAGRRATPLPSPDPALGGLVGVRGSLVAAFDLGVLLGVRTRAVATRWLALSAGDRQLALCFDELEGYRTVTRSALRAATGGGELAPRVLVEESGLRPLADVGKIVEFLARRAAAARSGKAR